MTEALLVIYFLVLLYAMRAKPRYVRGPWLFLLRTFFPNWKFFHAVGHVPHLRVRAGVRSGGEDIWSAWREIYPRRQRSVWHLFHNPQTNLGLAQQNLVDHFWADVYDLPEDGDIRQLVTYPMMLRLAHANLPESSTGVPWTHWQFDLHMVLEDCTGVVDAHTFVLGPILPVEEGT